MHLFICFTMNIHCITTLLLRQIIGMYDIIKVEATSNNFLTFLSPKKYLEKLI